MRSDEWRPDEWRVSDKVPRLVVTEFETVADCDSAEWAILIAAAPDLLAALEMVRDADEDCKTDALRRIPEMARQAIDAAIAKARGGK